MSQHSSLTKCWVSHCLRRPQVSLLSFVVEMWRSIRSLPLGDQALPPGGLRWPQQSLWTPVSRNLWELLFSLLQSTMGMLLYQGRFGETGYLSELACVGSCCFFWECQASSQGKQKYDFGGTQTMVSRSPQGSAAAGLCCVVLTLSGGRPD